MDNLSRCRAGHDAVRVSQLAALHCSAPFPPDASRYDAASFNSSYGLKTFVHHFAGPNATKMDPNLLGAANTAFTCGSIIPGYFITPSVSKRFGRRVAIFIGCFLVVIATFLQTFAPNFGTYIAGRLIVGMGHGFVMPTGPCYIAEIAPHAIRGRIMSFWQVSFTIGAFFVYWVAYGLKKADYLGDWQWRTIQILQLVFPLIVGIGILFCPESPRWLVERNRIPEARRIIRKIRAPDEVDAELETIVAAVEYERANINHGDSYLTPYKLIWTDVSVRKRFLLCLVINGGQQVCGNSQLGSFSTLIYQQVFADANTIFLINAIAASFNILFTLNCFWLVDRLGRRFLLITGAAGMAAALLCVASVGVGIKPGPDGHKPYGEGVAIAFLFFVFALFYKPSWGATVWIYTGEVFSQNVRAHAVAMASQWQHVCSAIVSQFFPLFLQNCGFYTFFFFAGVNALLCLFTIFFIPESKGVPLEEMDTLFGAKSHTSEQRPLSGDAKGATLAYSGESGDSTPRNEEDKGSGAGSVGPSEKNTPSLPSKPS